MTRTRRTVLSFLLTTYAAYLYVFMEWVYFATKASFMDTFTFGAKIGSWLLLALALSLVTAAATVLLAPLDGLLPGRARRLRTDILVPSLILGTLFFLLVDNFTYTITRWGVVRTGFITRWLWLILFGYLLYRSYRLLSEHVVGWLAARPLWPHLLAGVGLIAASVSFALFPLGNEVRHPGPIPEAEGAIDKPNIIYLATDGIESRWMSAYEQEVPTTPYLEKLAEESLVFENAFSNCGKTTGSIIAMLAGKLPSEVKVGFPPQILNRDDGYQHLPGLLRRLGYTGYQRTVRFYADAGDLNMVDSFDESNHRTLSTPEPGTFEHRVGYVFNSELMFAARITERLRSRLLHIFGIRPMVNHFMAVKENEGQSFAHDTETLERARDFIETTQGPFFMHLHLMGTHCCRFKGIPERFRPEQLAGYEDPGMRGTPAVVFSAIQESDALFEAFLESLRKTGVLDNSIVIISSDHTQNWDSVQRVPLMVRFPKGEYTGRVSRNVELVDVPATILDYMGVDIPKWMTSRSLLPDADRPPRQGLEPLGEHEPILSLAKFRYKRFSIGSGKLSRMTNAGPPLYGLKVAAAVVCNRWYKLNVETAGVQTGEVYGHTAPCPPDSQPSADEVARWIEASLETHGFDLP